MNTNPMVIDDLFEYIIERLAAETEGGNHVDTQYARGWNDAMNYAIDRVKKSRAQYRSPIDGSPLPKAAQKHEGVKE